MAKALIKDSYTNEKSCGSPANVRKRKLSHILETAPAILLNTIKKGFAKQNINSNNTSTIDQIVKNTYEYVARVAWERVCSKIITLCMFWGKLQAIM